MDAKPQSTLTSAFQDWRRRKVFRVAAAYGLGAWIFVESSSVVVPALYLPESLVTAAVIIAMLGFPVALVLSYVFDRTPDGIVRTKAASGDNSQAINRLSRRSIDFVIIAVLLAVIAYLWFTPRFGVDQRVDLKSIAVLPFVDLSQSGDSGYFGDGIAEELLNSLASVEGLRVAARTSSFAFKDSQTNIQTIGEELNVAAVLEGSVRHEGDKIRITAQLINVDDGFHLWSQTYERDFNDVFEIQDDIANQIVNALRPRLFGDTEEQKITVASSSDVDAWSLYVDGRHYWHQRTEESLNRALELFQRAIEIDPEYAHAYTGVADSYLLLNNYGHMDLDESIRNAEPAIAQALALDPTLGEAYASQGLLLMQRNEYDLAELALRKATELNPSLSMAHMWLGITLAELEGLQASYAEYQRAMEIDQLHPVINQNLAVTLSNMGRYEEAAQRFEQVLRFNPTRVPTMVQYAFIALNNGRVQKAVEMATRALRQDPVSPDALTVSAQIKLILGDFAGAQGLIDTARTNGTPPDKLTGPTFMLRYAQGDIQGALEVSMQELNGLDWRSELLGLEVFRLIRPGIASIFADKPQQGVELLERFFADPKLSGKSDPYDQILIGSALALGYMETDREQEADLRLQKNLDIYNAAIHDGWGDPRIHMSMFVNYLALGDTDLAKAELRLAMDGGWSDYWVAMGGPLGDMIRSDPELSDLMAELRAHIESVRNQVEMAEASLTN